MTKKLTTFAALVAAMMFVSQSSARDQVDPAGAGQANDNADVATPGAATPSAAAPAAAADPAGQSDAPAADAQPAAGRQGQAGQSGKLGEMDQKFVMKAADTNGFEIAAAELAQQKARDNQQIQEYAKHVIKDHQTANQQLQKIAQQKGMSWPRDLMPVHKAMLEDLQQKEGQEFEKDYLYGQIAGHLKTVLRFRDASEMLQDPDLKSFASEQLPTLREHMAHAERAAGVEQEITASFREGASAGGSGDKHATPDASGGGNAPQTTPPGGERQNPGAGAGGESGTGSDASGAGASGTDASGAGTAEESARDREAR